MIACCICEFIYNTIYLCIFYLLYKIARGLQVYIFRKRKDLLKLYSDDGKIPWAAVTGATSGIGQALAHELAHIGFNIILISRSINKLQATQQSIRKKYPDIEVQYVQADLGKDSSPQFYQDLCKKINQKYDIGIFINNAGVLHMGDFLSLEPSQIHQMIQVNNGPYSMLLRHIMPKMMQRGSRSGVINISSIAGIFNQPFNTVYSATKAFDDFFSRSLAHQVHKKIDVLCVNPAGVESNMSKLRKRFGVIGADQCAKGILTQLGYQINTFAHWNHATQANIAAFISYILPFKWRLAFFKYAYQQFRKQQAKFD